MATAVQLKDYFSLDIEQERDNLYSLIWLDEIAIDEEMRTAEQELRSIINHLKRFRDVKQCREYIEQRSQRHRLILVVSGQLGREIVPSLHKFQQLISIYVYCMDERKTRSGLVNTAR